VCLSSRAVEGNPHIYNCKVWNDRFTYKYI
jgi:hypothetical protein